MKMLAALSGGVDSAVAAAAALEAGHQVTGVYLALLPGSPTGSGVCWVTGSEPGDTRAVAQAPHEKTQEVKPGGGEAPAGAAGAQATADRLGIDLQVWDLSGEFAQLVVQDFIDQYAAGRTPNPCVRCNQHIKFGLLQRRALDLGFDKVCTGHYARLETSGGFVALRRAKDLAKDQSYVLAAAGAVALARSWFPLGQVASKTEVRQRATNLGLAAAKQPDSLDICFIPDGNTAGFLRSHLGERPGELIDQTGKVLGQHSGTYQFTVGQRRGLRLSDPAPGGQPRYVTAIDATTGQVRIGATADLEVWRFAVSALEWLVPPANTTVPALVQVRAHSQAMPCRVLAGHNRHTVELDQPIRGLAAGQSAVFYRDDLVLGHGIIEPGGC